MDQISHRRFKYQKIQIHWNLEVHFLAKKNSEFS